MSSALHLTREQVLSYRRRAGDLDVRRSRDAQTIRRAAWAGLQDSMPRAALLSLHARVDGIDPQAWHDPALVQLWGPRYSAYAVPGQDVAVFTLGRFPEAKSGGRQANDIADRLDAFLDGRTMSAGEIGKALGIHPSALRYAAPTGRVLIRWDGARRPAVWTVPAPGIEPMAARAELARRYLHAFGPATAASFAQWAGIRPPVGKAAFDTLAGALIPVRTPIGEGWVLAENEPGFHVSANDGDAVRLLPSGDTYFLLWGADRELLIPDARRRPELWTSRVWPGALLVGGEVVGIWRRAGAAVTINPWRRLSPAERNAVEGRPPRCRCPTLERWSFTGHPDLEGGLDMHVVGSIHDCRDTSRWPGSRENAPVAAQRVSRCGGRDPRQRGVLQS